VQIIRLTKLGNTTVVSGKRLARVDLPGFMLRKQTYSCRPIDTAIFAGAKYTIFDQVIA
jgi:hypothetical protein